MALRDVPVRTNPVPFGKDHTADSWDRQRKNVERMYLEDDVTLDDLPATMKQQHGFTANRRQYITRIRKWGLHKNLKDTELRIIYRKLLQREAMGKQTRFTVNGREVQLEHILKCVKRKRIPDNLSLLPKDATPYHIIGFTPSSLPDQHAPPKMAGIRGKAKSQESDCLPDELEFFHQAVLQLIDHAFASELELRIILLLELYEPWKWEDPYPRVQFLEALASDFRRSCRECCGTGDCAAHSAHIDRAELNRMRDDLLHRLAQSGLMVWDPCCTRCCSSIALPSPKYLLLCPTHFSPFVSPSADTGRSPDAPADLDIAGTLSTSIQEPASLLQLGHKPEYDSNVDWVHLGTGNTDELTAYESDGEGLDTVTVDLDNTENTLWTSNFPDASSASGSGASWEMARHFWCSVCNLTHACSEELLEHDMMVHGKGLPWPKIDTLEPHADWNDLSVDPGIFASKGLMTGYCDYDIRERPAAVLEIDMDLLMATYPDTWGQFRELWKQ